KETPKSVPAVPLDMRVQVAPASVVRRIVPCSPTAIVVLAFSAATARRMFPVGSGFWPIQPESAPPIPAAKTQSIEFLSIFISPPDRAVTVRERLREAPKHPG